VLSVSGFALELKLCFQATDLLLQHVTFMLNLYQESV
jgi:hypothetical protein